MEAVGLGIGIVGLASLFSTCLDCFDYIDSARSYERDSEILVGKLLIQRVRLALWGDLVGLTDDADDVFETIRQSPAQEAGVRICLNSIEKLLTSAQRLVEVHATGVVGDVYTPSHALIEQEGRVARLKKGLGISCSLQSKNTASVALKKRVTWAVRDKSRMTCVVEDVKDYVDGLHQVVPAIQPRHNRLVQRSINLVTDIEALQLVLEATMEDYPG